MLLSTRGIGPGVKFLTCCESGPTNCAKWSFIFKSLGNSFVAYNIVFSIYIKYLAVYWHVSMWKEPTEVSLRSKTHMQYYLCCHWIPLDQHPNKAILEQIHRKDFTMKKFSMLCTMTRYLIKFKNNGIGHIRSDKR